MDTGTKKKSYSKNWKKWVAIYLAVGAVVYFGIYLIATSGGKGGGY